jgi:hypothetical protein
LQQNVHRVIFPEKKKKKKKKEQPVHARTLEIFGNTGRIRVAVIDTGLELSEAAMDSLDPDGERIKECVSFFDDDSKNDDKDGNPIAIKGFIDLDGHGTHSAALVLKVAPTVELYVARVFKTRDENDPSVTAAHIQERVARVSYCVFVPSVSWIPLNTNGLFTPDIGDKLCRNGVEGRRDINVFWICRP